MTCQVANCNATLAGLRSYNLRYRVCQAHASAASVLLLDPSGCTSAPQQCRFCQQCGKFHKLDEFEGLKKSCRTRLERHNEARRQRRRQGAAREPPGSQGAAAAQEARSRRQRQPARSQQQQRLSPRTPPGPSRSSSLPLQPAEPIGSSGNNTDGDEQQEEDQQRAPPAAPAPAAADEEEEQAEQQGLQMAAVGKSAPDRRTRRTRTKAAARRQQQEEQQQQQAEQQAEQQQPAPAVAALSDDEWLLRLTALIQPGQLPNTNKSGSKGGAGSGSSSGANDGPLSRPASSTAAAASGDKGTAMPPASSSPWSQADEQPGGLVQTAWQQNSGGQRSNSGGSEGHDALAASAVALSDQAQQQRGLHHGTHGMAPSAASAVAECSGSGSPFPCQQLVNAVFAQRQQCWQLETAVAHLRRHNHQQFMVMRQYSAPAATTDPHQQWTGQQDWDLPACSPASPTDNMAVAACLDPLAVGLSSSHQAVRSAFQAAEQQAEQQQQQPVVEMSWQQGQLSPHDDSGVSWPQLTGGSAGQPTPFAASASAGFQRSFITACGGRARSNSLPAQQQHLCGEQQRLRVAQVFAAAAVATLPGEPVMSEAGRASGAWGHAAAPVRCSSETAAAGGNSGGFSAAADLRGWRSLPADLPHHHSAAWQLEGQQEASESLMQQQQQQHEAALLAAAAGGAAEERYHAQLFEAAAAVQGAANGPGWQAQAPAADAGLAGAGAGWPADLSLREVESLLRWSADWGGGRGEVQLLREAPAAGI